MGSAITFPPVSWEVWRKNVVLDENRGVCCEDLAVVARRMLGANLKHLSGAQWKRAMPLSSVAQEGAPPSWYHHPVYGEMLPLPLPLLAKRSAWL